MWTKILITAVLIETCLGASIVPCPESCRCLLQGNTFDAKIAIDCTSLDFLNRLLPKQINAIVELNASSISLEIVDSKLKNLKNLESLDLSHNRIASVAKFPVLPKLKHLSLKGNQLKDVTDLPESLETVDLSANYLYRIAKEWTSLKKLKEIDLNKNAIECTCETVLYYNELVEMGVQFETPVTCASPKTFSGKELKHVNCSMIADNLLNTMIGDEPQLDEDNILESEDTSDREDHDYIATSSSDKVVPDEVKNTDEFEGSGDEGSGQMIFEPETDEVPKACHLNCSTLAPIGVNDEDNASPPPSLSESAKILFEDIIGKSEPTENQPQEKQHEEMQTEDKPVIVEDSFKKVRVGKVNQQVPTKEIEELNIHKSDKDDVDFVPTKEIVSRDMERASLEVETKNSSLTFYVIGSIVLIFMVLIAFVIIKKRKNNNRRAKTTLSENGHYEEMKPLNSNGKAAEIETIIPKTPENTPLIKEENGKIDPLQTYVDNESQKSEPSNEDNELRRNDIENHSPKSDTLKVTIKAAELPDSVPKTPILVQRQLNNDGNYTTTFQSSP